MRELRFASVEEYLRKLHPEYDFIFSIKESAQARWNYKPKDAERTQAHMIENAFEVAKRADEEKGLEIIIEGIDARQLDAPTPRLVPMSGRFNVRPALPAHHAPEYP